MLGRKNLSPGQSRRKPFYCWLRWQQGTETGVVHELCLPKQERSEVLPVLCALQVRQGLFECPASQCGWAILGDCSLFASIEEERNQSSGAHQLNLWLNFWSTARHVWWEDCCIQQLQGTSHHVSRLQKHRVAETDIINVH